MRLFTIVEKSGRKKCLVCETGFSNGEIVFELPSSCYKSNMHYRYGHIRCVLDKQEVMPVPSLYEKIYRGWSERKAMERL